MIEVQDIIKQAYDISTTQIDKIVVNNQEYRINKVQYDDDDYEEGNIFGTAIARTLEFEIENVVDLENKEFEYFTGVYIENEVKWTSLGNFITQDVEPNDTTNISKIFAMDYMLKTNIKYKPVLDYSTATLLTVAQAVCLQSGLILGTINFANSNFRVDSNQFEENALNRQVIQAIAQMSGTVAKIRSDNKLYFINPNEEKTVSKVFELSNYEEAEIKRVTQPINVVTLGLTDVDGENTTLRDEESIKKYGENALIINDNPFAYTQAKREQLITALFNAVKGFEYKAYTLKNCQALFYLETLDKIQLKDRSGNVYNSYIFRFNYKSPNGLESTIEAPSITKATVKYQNLPDALDVAKKTEFRVDKQEQKIEQLTQETSEFGEKLVEHQQDIDGLKQSVYDMATYKREQEGFTELHLTDADSVNMLEFKVRANKTHVSALQPRNNLYPSSNIHPREGG